MKRVDLKVGFSCNNHCLFCVQGRKREEIGNKTTQGIKKEMREAVKECQEIVLTGGEPTIRPDFLGLIKYAKNLGFTTIQVQTNGRMFAYRDFCQKTIEAGTNEFAFSLHGHIPELHDYLTTVPGSFRQTVQGIRNLKTFSQRVITNTVVTKSNYRHLPEIAKFLISLGVDQYQFAFVHPVGSAEENFESIVPQFSLIEPYIKRGLDIGIKAGKIVMTEAIPYCFMQGHEDYIAEKIIPQTKIYDYNKIIENFTVSRQKEGKAKGHQCSGCYYNQICEGPWREYPERFGWSEFKPIIRSRHKIKSDHHQVLKIIERIFDLLIKENHLLRHKTVIHQIRITLFSNFNPSWLSKNQKFDFSFSAYNKKEGGLRFSYNNYGEKNDFNQKILTIFDLLKGNYNKKSLIKILNLMKKTNDKHQTTLGVEWPKDKKQPRLKVYFEELFHQYSRIERLQKIRQVCSLINLKYHSLGLKKEDNVGAFCVDFFPDGQINLKVYLLYRQIKERDLEKITFDQKWQLPITKVQSFLNLLSERRCFYYITKRFDSYGKLFSLKLYKIYEVKQFKNFSKAISEILSFLIELKLNSQLKQIKRLLNLCKIHQALFYPVIISIDFSKNNFKVDSYFSIKK